MEQQISRRPAGKGAAALATAMVAASCTSGTRAHRARRQALVEAVLYDLVFTGWTMDIPDPDELVTFAVSPRGGTQAFYTGYANPRLAAAQRRALRSWRERRAAPSIRRPISAPASPLTTRTTTPTMPHGEVGSSSEAPIAL